MLRLYFFIVLLFATVFTASSQTYHSLPKGAAIWSEIHRHSEFVPFTMQFVKLSTTDTVIGGVTYRKVYKSSDTIFTEPEQIGGMREDTLAHRIYGYLYYGVCAYQDMLMYDFNVQPGDTLKGMGNGNCVNWISDLLVHSVDSMLIDGSYRKRINLRLTFAPNVDILPSAWVEGIGNIVRGLVFSSGNMPNNGMWNELICVNEGTQTLYHDSTDWNTYDSDTTYLLFPDCFSILQGVTTLRQQPAVTLVPSPVVYESKLILPAGSHVMHLYIYDMSGRLLKEERLRDKQSVIIHRSDFVPGNYIWKLTSESGQVFQGKMVVE